MEIFSLRPMASFSSTIEITSRAFSTDRKQNYALSKNRDRATCVYRPENVPVSSCFRETTRKVFIKWSDFSYCTLPVSRFK